MLPVTTAEDGIVLSVAWEAVLNGATDALAAEECAKTGRLLA